MLNVSSAELKSNLDQLAAQEDKIFIIESFKHFKHCRKESEFKFNITPFSPFSFCFLYPPLRVPFPPLPRDKKYVSQFMIEDE